MHQLCMPLLVRLKQLKQERLFTCFCRCPCIIPALRDVHTGSDKRRHGDQRPLAISNEKPTAGRAKGLLLTSLNFRGKQLKQPPMREIPAHYDHDASL